MIIRLDSYHNLGPTHRDRSIIPWAYLRIKEALVGVAEALAALALVGRDKLAGPPPLLVVHGAAGVTELPAGVVATPALVVTSDLQAGQAS